ncbi:transposase [Natronorarus salvus]|uniref:transposase n=1 Tax=Natronorarus salvus TaxID=3117733 RepID=UPI002F261182
MGQQTVSSRRRPHRGRRRRLSVVHHELAEWEFSPEDVSTLYHARWVVELLFLELKSQYGLGRFQTGKEQIVRTQVTAALLTLVVSRAILRLFVDHA